MMDANQALLDAAQLLDDPDWSGPNRGMPAAVRALNRACPESEPGADECVQDALGLLRDRLGMQLSRWEVDRARVASTMRTVGGGML